MRVEVVAITESQNKNTETVNLAHWMDAKSFPRLLREEKQIEVSGKH